MLPCAPVSIVQVCCCLHGPCRLHLLYCAHGMAGHWHGRLHRTRTSRRNPLHTCKETHMPLTAFTVNTTWPCTLRPAEMHWQRAHAGRMQGSCFPNLSSTVPCACMYKHLTACCLDTMLRTWTDLAPHPIYPSHISSPQAAASRLSEPIRMCTPCSLSPHIQPACMCTCLLHPNTCPHVSIHHLCQSHSLNHHRAYNKSSLHNGQQSSSLYGRSTPSFLPASVVQMHLSQHHPCTCT